MTKSGPSIRIGTVRGVITTGGVCLNDEEKGQIGLSGFGRLRMPEATGTPPFGFQFGSDRDATVRLPGNRKNCYLLQC